MTQSTRGKWALAVLLSAENSSCWHMRSMDHHGFMDHQNILKPPMAFHSFSFSEILTLNSSCVCVPTQIPTYCSSSNLSLVAPLTDPFWCLGKLLVSWWWLSNAWMIPRVTLVPKSWSCELPVQSVHFEKATPRHEKCYFPMLSCSKAWKFSGAHHRQVALKSPAMATCGAVPWVF